MPNTLPIPTQPLKLALIGAGRRAQEVYQPFWEDCKPWCVPVAVCDPVDVEAMLAVSFPRP